jgi:hypothetical protein
MGSGRGQTATEDPGPLVLPGPVCPPSTVFHSVQTDPGGSAAPKITATLPRGVGTRPSVHRPKWDDAGEATTVWGEINPPFFIYGWKAGPELPEIGLDGVE